MRKTILGLVALIFSFISFSTVVAAEDLTKNLVYTDQPEYGSVYNGIQPTADGGWVVAGYKDEMFIMKKISASGEKEWENAFYPGMMASTLITTSDGGFLAGGQTHILTDEEGIQAIAVKLDKDGNLEWNKEYGGKGSESIDSIVETEDGYLVAGNIEDGTTNRAVLTKLGHDGELLGTITLSPKTKYDIHDQIYTSKITKVNDGYIAAVSYNAKDDQAYYGMRAVLIKLNQNLEVEWQKDIRNVFTMAATKDGGTIVATQVSHSDLNLIRFSPNGNIFWQKTYSPVFSRAFNQISPSDVVESLDGGFVVAGSADTLNSQIAYVLKVDKNGEREWEDTFFTTDSYFKSIALSKNNTYAAAGVDDKHKGTVVQFTTSEQSPIRVKINGELLPLSQDPTLVQGTTLLPMRDLFEALGADVHYYAAEKKVVGIRGERTIELTLGEKEAVLTNDGVRKTLQLAVPAQIINSKTMVPIRFVSESLGDQVNWNQEERVVEVDR